MKKAAAHKTQKMGGGGEEQKRLRENGGGEEFIYGIISWPLMNACANYLIMYHKQRQ